MDFSINSIANVAAIPKRTASSEKSGQEERNIGQDNVALVSASGTTDKVSKPSTQSNGEPSGQPEKTKDRVDSALKNINSFFQMSKRTMQFSVSEGSGKMVVEIKDEKTGEVIRQIPSEEVLQLEKKLDEVQGLLFSKKA
ncbi:MAG: flagellar protein FlaG [Methylovulum sp.]|nr:flagellar protein FlaG [Methylovulum sp.]